VSTSPAVLRTRVRLARNFADIPFPGKASAEARAEVVRRVESALGVKAQDVAEMSKADRLWLAERRTISSQMAEHGGHFIDLEHGKTVILINEEDHLRIQVFSRSIATLQDDLYEAYKIAAAIEQVAPFAWHDEWGYLASCPTNFGSGVRFSALVHLVALGLNEKEEESILSRVSETVAVRGTWGEGSPSVGHIWQLASVDTMADPFVMLEEFQRTVRWVAEKEEHVIQMVREQIHLPHVAPLRQQILHCYREAENAPALSYGESIGLMSLLRLGALVGVGPDHLADPVHFLAACEKMGAGYLLKKGADNLNQARAEVLREEMKA